VLTKRGRRGIRITELLNFKMYTSITTARNSLPELAVAMATDAPDPRTFQSWEDAFQYPIPVVRKLEQQLRNNADDNREKLRSLVG
jgi:hypothetical protein